MNVTNYIRYAITSWWDLASSQKPEGRIAILSRVWTHHSRWSGYRHISDGIGAVLPTRHIQLVPKTISRLIVGDGLDAAYQIALAMKLMGRDRLLILEGEYQLKLIEDLRKVTKVRIFAAFHQIPRLLEGCLAQTSRQILDGAICVARCQIPLVQSLAPPGKTWFVPHGVDTDRFAPSEFFSDQPRVLCVGDYCRDFETLRKSAALIIRAFPNASVRLIAPRAHLPPGLNLEQVNLISGLSDDQLLEEYRQAWVVLLPLLDSTANNAILESLACGRPIVASDVGGVSDYTSPQCGALCPPGDAEAHSEATIALLNDPLLRVAAGRTARAFAQKCSWPVVREKIRMILDDEAPSMAAFQGGQ